MFRSPFESFFVKIKSLLKFVFFPSWRLAYLVVKYVRKGYTTQEAMALAGVIEP